MGLVDTNARGLASNVRPLRHRQNSMQNKEIKIPFHVIAPVVGTTEHMWEHCCLIRASL